MVSIYAIQFLILVGSTLLSYVLGWLLTEKYRIADINTLFQFKAFECRKCLSFHICWVLNTFLSLCFNNYVMLVFGIIFAIFLYLGLYFDEKSRFID